MQVEEFLEKKTREERLGPSVDKLADEDLFFVDTKPEDTSVLSTKRKSRKELNRNKLTRAQAIIQSSKAAEPVIPQIFSRKVSVQSQKQLKGQKKDSLGVAKNVNGVLTVPKEGGYDLFSKSTEEFNIRNKAVKAVKLWKKSLRSVPAVEIDPSGCSINPEYESHQEAVAEAVAVEMKKQYDRDLLPVAPPKVVGWEDYEHKDELERLLVASESEEEEESDESEEEDDSKRTSKRNKKTIKDRNRQARNKILEKEMTLRKKERQQRRDLENLKHISEEVHTLEQDREERLKRRQADLEDLMNSEPPRLGKHKFTPMPIQVLTTEEIQESGGSLRKIKPTPILAKERYKSLQRRGIIEPRIKMQKSGKKRKVVIHGKRADNAEERHDEIQKLKASNKKGIKK